MNASKSFNNEETLSSNPFDKYFIKNITLASKRSIDGIIKPYLPSPRWENKLPNKVENEYTAGVVDGVVPGNIKSFTGGFGAPRVGNGGVAAGSNVVGYVGTGSADIGPGFCPKKSKSSIVWTGTRQ